MINQFIIIKFSCLNYNFWIFGAYDIFINNWLILILFYHLFFLFLLTWLLWAGLFSTLAGYSFFGTSTLGAGSYFFTGSYFFSTIVSSPSLGFLDLFLFFPDFGSYFDTGVTGEDFY